jgi:signal transduction histidine kinase
LSAHVKLLERRDVDADTIGAMKEQIDRAARFIEDLLKYGRPRPLELRLVDLAATADLALSTAKQGLGRPSDDVELVREHALPAPLVEADQAQLAQALVIILDNALLALEDAPKKTIRIRTAAEADAVRLLVEDSGPGIPEAIKDRLFQPFVSSRPREGPRPGTGLGLAIAKNIIERHHGRISAGKSALGGAALEVILPRAQPVLAPSGSDP